MNTPDTQQKSQLQFLYCPTCKGFGYLVTPAGTPQTCSQCHGNGSIVAWFGGKILFWKMKVSRIVLLEEQIVRFVKSFRIGILAIIAASGMVLFLLEFWNIVTTGGTFLDLVRVQSFELGVFYTSLLFDFYAWYLFYRERMVSHPIPWRSVKREDFDIPIPANDYNGLMHVPHTKYVDISEAFSQVSLKLLEQSFSFADDLRSPSVEPIHIFAVLLPTSKMRLVLGRLGLPPENLTTRIESILQRNSQRANHEPVIGFKWQQILFVAYEEAFKAKRDQVEPTDILFALVKADKSIHDIFYDLDVDVAKLRHVVSWTYEQKKLVDRVRGWQREASLKPRNTMNRSMTARPTKTLDAISQDLTVLASQGAYFPLIGREKEMDDMFRALKEIGGSVLILGQPGVGKSALIQGLAEMMSAEQVPDEIKDLRLVSMNVGALLAGATGVGAVEQRMLTALNEIVMAGNVILVIEDVASLFSGVSGVASESANILSNFISQGRTKVITTVTTEDYMRYLENNISFLRRFQRIEMKEPDFDLAMQILQSRSGIFEYRHKVFFSYDALESAIHLTARYMHDRYLPEKAIDILEQSAILASESRGQNSIVTKEDVAIIVSDKANVDVKQVSDNDKEKLLNLEDTIHERMVDQEEAVSAVASALRRARQELRDTKRPIANFLFLGPTGVGKTELAKSVSEVYFGDEKRMVRIDMSEYQDKASIYRLIGSPGAGRDEKGGYLTEAIRQSPFTLLLLDEIEKAHPDILNIFLQVMDDGRLTDSLGRTISFTETIIIATSNAGAQYIQKEVRAGSSIESIKSHLLESELNNYFRPEFINRFDGVVVFKPLSKEDVFQITKIMLARVSRELESKGVFFEVSDEAAREVSEKGYDPQFGARPLRRVIQNEVEDTLAQFLLKGDLGRRDKVILEKGGKLRVERAEQFV